jgi:hypothetical protein
LPSVDLGKDSGKNLTGFAGEPVVGLTEGQIFIPALPMASEMCGFQRLQQSSIALIRQFTGTRSLKNSCAARDLTFSGVPM